MLKTRKVISMVLVAAMVAAMLVVGIVATGAAQGNSYFLTGSIASWGPNDNFLMTKTENADHEEYMIEGVALKTTDMIKAIKSSKSGDEAAEWYPDGMDNNISVEEDGIYTVYFRPAGDGEEDWYYCYYAGEKDDGGANNHGGKLFNFVKTADLPADSTPDESTPDPDPEPTETITITVINEAGWDGVNVHYWGNGETSWPGIAMTDNGDGTYSATVPAGVIGFVFNTGTGSPQTSDIGEIYDGVVYTIDADGNVSVTTPDPDDDTPDEPDPEPTPDPDKKTTVTCDGHTFDAHVGDTVDIAVYLNLAGLPTAEGGKVGYATEIQGSIYFDDTKLKLLTDVTAFDEDNDVYEAMPNIKGGNVAISADTAGKVGYNAMKPAGYKFDEEKLVIYLEFEVIATGESELTSIIEGLGSGEVKLIQGSEVLDITQKPEVRIEWGVTCPHTTPDPEPQPGDDTPDEPEPQPSGKSTVTVIDWSGATETKVVEVGDEITVTSYLKVPEGKKVNSIDIAQEFNIDADMLELLTDIENDDDVFPIIDDATANVEGNVIKANATKAKFKQAYAFDSDDSILIQTKYKVVAEGNCSIKTDIVTLATISEDNSMATQISESEKTGDDEIVTVTTLDAPEHADPEPTPQPGDDTPDEPQPGDDTPDEPTPGEDTPDEPGYDGVLIKADGVYYAVEKGDVFTYVFYLNTGEKVCSLDAETFFDIEGLEFQGDTDEGLEDLFPIIKDAMVVNDSQAGRLKYNYSAAKGKNFNTDDSILIKADFLVTAESGVYEINTLLHTVAGADEHRYIFDDVVEDALQRGDSVLLDVNGTEIEPYDGPIPGPTPGPEPQPGDDTPDEPTPGPEPQPGDDTPDEPTPGPEPGPEPHVDPTPATPDNPDAPTTGSTEMAVFFLMVLVLSAGVVVFVKKRRFN